jgi:ubiquinone/menaquinone biosynthesis C-methylase UbiE
MTRVTVRGSLLALLIAVTAVPAFAQQDRGRRLFPPEELGVLEGPDRDAWQKPDLVMDALRVGEGSAVADVGAGGGWFTVRLARRVGPNGTVYAQDVQPQMLEAIGRRVQREGFRNVKPVRGEPDDPKLPSGALDAALIVDSYHEFPNPVALLSRLGASLKIGGRIGIVNFTKDGGGPGPPMSDRVDPQKVIDEAGQAGLRLLSRESFLDFQYMLIFGR